MLVLSPHLLLKAFWTALYWNTSNYMDIFSMGGEYGYYNKLASQFPDLISQNDYFPIIDNGKEIEYITWTSSASDCMWDDTEILYQIMEEESIKDTFTEMVKLIYKETPISISGYPHMCTSDIRGP